MPLGHQLLVLLFYDADGSSHAAYKVRSADQVRAGGQGCKHANPLLVLPAEGSTSD